MKGRNERIFYHGNLDLESQERKVFLTMTIWDFRSKLQVDRAPRAKDYERSEHFTWINFVGVDVSCAYEPRMIMIACLARSSSGGGGLPAGRLA